MKEVFEDALNRVRESEQNKSLSSVEVSTRTDDQQIPPIPSALGNDQPQVERKPKLDDESFVFRLVVKISRTCRFNSS